MQYSKHHLVLLFARYTVHSIFLPHPASPHIEVNSAVPLLASPVFTRLGNKQGRRGDHWCCSPLPVLLPPYQDGGRTGTGLSS